MNKTLKITGEELRRAVEMDPEWVAKNATKHRKVAVTTFCDLSNTGITHLSPFIEFFVPNQQGVCGNFARCKALRKAEGKFHGGVSFEGSGIDAIGGLNITRPDFSWSAANFTNCLHLQVARGTYPGEVLFGGSGIEEINNLKVTSPNFNGHAASFRWCANLKALDGDFRGMVDASNSGIQEVRKSLRIKLKKDQPGLKLNLSGCEKLVRCPETLYHDPKVFIDVDTAKRILNTRKAKETLKASPTIEI